MNTRWRARVSTSYRADGCNSASRQSRMMFNTVTVPALRPVRRTDAPQRPLMVAPTCQSDIKRTLRRCSRRRKTAPRPGFCRARVASFNSDGERRVSGTDPIWFRKGGRCTCGFIKATPPSIENLRRIESFGLLAMFRRIELNANTCDLSTAASKARRREINAAGPKKRRPGSRNVFSASHGVLARAGARAVAEGQDA